MILLAILFQTSELDELIKRDLNRIEKRPELTETQKKEYKSVKTWHKEDKLKQLLVTKKELAVSILPLEFADTPVQIDYSLFKTVQDFFNLESNANIVFKFSVLDNLKLSQSKEDFQKKRITETESLKELLKDKGANICIVYGGKMPKDMDSILWPHQNNIVGKDIKYCMLPEEAGKFSKSIYCHEISHFLGLKDKYDQFNSTCLMAKGYLETERVASLCLACKEQLGWITPAVYKAGFYFKEMIKIDASIPLRIDLNPDKSEYLILCQTPNSLLVWHVVDQQCNLTAELDSKKQDRLSPYSLNPLKIIQQGSRKVFITDVKIEKGISYFTISSDAQLTELETWLIQFRKKLCKN